MKTKKIAFLWDNFGPLHVDRCESVSTKEKNFVVGIELYSVSSTYDWISEAGKSFNKITLCKNVDESKVFVLLRLIRLRHKHGSFNWFLCHYDKTEIFLFALYLRLLGDNVFTMGCSKFDDVKRSVIKEFFKQFYLLPYEGALGSGIRSRDYFRFLGITPIKIVGEYNTVSIKRIRDLSLSEPAPSGEPFVQRHFTIVARLVPKKNLSMALVAYSKYCVESNNPRDLHICGSGPLEDDLKLEAFRLGLSDKIKFHGFIQTENISKIFATSLALILISVEEQFGNVVVEAQAMGLPVILSINCGARDNLVRSGINGFVVEDDNPIGLAWFMLNISENQQLWQKMCVSAVEYSFKSDVSLFADGVDTLVG